MSEREWIHKYIRPLVRADGADFLRDDVALLKSSSKTIITMDALVEGQHFLPNDPLNTVGQKLVRVNVSDIHAKGAVGQEALFSVAWPHGRREEDFAQLMRGLGEDLAHYQIDLIGGDFVTTNGPLVLTLTLTGLCLRDKPVRRDGRAPVGASVWVSGKIGSGAVGLEAARTGGHERRIEHYRVPQTTWPMDAKRVAEHGLAAMDVSDGLLQDSLTLAEVNGRGIELDLSKVPLADPVGDLKDIFQQVTGGDDYQILMVTHPEDDLVGGVFPTDKLTDFALQGLDVGLVHSLFSQQSEFTRIGHLTREPGLQLRHQGRFVNPPSTLGFEH